MTSKMSGMTLALIFSLLALVEKGQADSCLTNPAAPSCASYIYSDDQARADIDDNCFQMPWMIGCSVWNACQDGKMPPSNPYCKPFSVLGDMCIDNDMAGMSGCRNWRALCASSNSTVQQCRTTAPIPRVVATAASQSAIIASCADHNMGGCEDCRGPNNQCMDTLRSLQTVCLGMKMDMCADYNAMCTAAGPDLDYFCNLGAGNFDPPMRMYFHGGITDIILFRGWVPRSNGEYFGAILAVLLAGMFVSAIRAYRACCEAFYRIRDNLHIRHMPHEVSNANIFVMERARVGPHIQRSALTFVMVIIDYSLMLAAMSFNTGIFFAVCAGLALGMLCFGHIPERYSQRLQAKTILSSDIECGCGTMIANQTTFAPPKPDPADDALTHNNSEASDPSSESTRTSEVPLTASCCSKTAAPTCCGGSEFEALTVRDAKLGEGAAGGADARPAQFRGKICCTMKPILDVEEAAQASSTEQAATMVPHCCRM